MLEAAIHEINNHNASGLSFEELYRRASEALEFKKAGKCPRPKAIQDTRAQDA